MLFLLFLGVILTPVGMFVLYSSKNLLRQDNIPLSRRFDARAIAGIVMLLLGTVLMVVPPLTIIL